MQLTDLPEEVLIIIFRNCDFYTLESLYYTCQLFKNIVCLHGVVREGCMSLNQSATVTKFKTDYFKAISLHLQTLNVCGVPDLTKTALLAALKRLKKLKVLDVSFTNLTVFDLFDINKVCPTIRDIAINIKCSECSKVPINIVMQSQAVLVHYANIHLVGSCNVLLYSKLSYYIISKATVNNLKFTIATKNCLHYIDQEYQENSKLPYFNQFTVNILNWSLGKPASFPIMNNMHLNNNSIPSFYEIHKYEYLIIVFSNNKIQVWATPIFVDFFKENFNIAVQLMPQSEINLSANSVVMIWNKVTKKFDNKFWNKLLKQVKQCIPYYFELNNVSNMMPDPAKRNWFCHVPKSDDYLPCVRPVEYFGMSRKRQAAPSLILNYDDIFQEKDHAELTLEFNYSTNITISLDEKCSYLEKLTYFSLIGFGRTSANFFKILFSCCYNLVTLNVQALPLTAVTLPISRSITMSRSLKNIRLVDKRIDMKTLFNSFSFCPQLENIHVVDASTNELNNLTDFSAVIKNCDNLYSIYAEAHISGTAKANTMRLCNKAKTTFKKPYVHVNIQSIKEINTDHYDPFLEVFRLTPISPHNKHF